MLSKRVLVILLVLIAIALLSFASNPHVIPPAMKDMVADHTQHRSRLPQEYPREPPLPHRGIADRTFLLLKTGIEVAYNRFPAHFDTTFKMYPHHASYADTDDTINGVPMIDAISFMDEKTLNHPNLAAYVARRQVKANGWHWKSERIYVPNDPQGGWNLDRFKNVPAFAHAYVNYPDFDWYVMMDADSYIPASTLEEVTRGHSPDEPFYFGKGVGAGPVFAHGGSGIVLSRGALEGMFGDTPESIQMAIAKSGEIALNDCCGDRVTSAVYEWGNAVLSGDTLQYEELGQFQGDPISFTHVHFSQWCNPVGTFHMLPPWEIADLFQWEIEMGDKTVLYSDFYQKFILPEIAQEKPYWFVELSNMGLNVRTYTNPDIEAMEKTRCYQACESDPECTMWQFLGNDKCQIIRQSVTRGKAVNQFAGEWNNNWSTVTVGYMIDRIQTFRASQKCDLGSDKKEGYAYKYSAPGKLHLLPAPLKEPAHKALDANNLP